MPIARRSDVLRKISPTIETPIASALSGIAERGPRSPITCSHPGCTSPDRAGRSHSHADTQAISSQLENTASRCNSDAAEIDDVAGDRLKTSNFDLTSSYSTDN